MMPGEESRRIERVERVRDHRARGLGCETVAPLISAEVEAELEDALDGIAFGPNGPRAPRPLRSRIARPQSTTADVTFVVEAKDRPVLHAMLTLEPDLLVEPRANACV